MKKNMVIATDLDGTLFYPRAKLRMIGKKNRLFLERYMNDGGKLLIVSSRNTLFSQKVSKNIGVPLDSICCNGALIYSGGKIIKETTFKKEDAMRILSKMWDEYGTSFVASMSKEHNMVLAKSDNGFMSNFMFWCYQLVQGVYREPAIKSNEVFYDDIFSGKTFKFMTLLGITHSKIKKSKELNKILREEFPEAEFSWCNQAIEITPKGCSKGQALEFYLDYNSIPRDNVIVVGDSGNDISMFEQFKNNSFCLEHGSSSVKKHAAHVIRRFYDLEKYIYPSVEKTK